MKRAKPTKQQTSETMLEVVKLFRKLEVETDAVAILGDDHAIRVLAAWQKTDQTFVLPARPMPVMTPRNHAELWHWLCVGWTIDTNAVQRASGLPASIVHAKLEQLVENRLIYPDGSTSTGGQLAMQVFIAKQVKAAGGGKNKGDDSDGESSSDNN